MSTTLITLNLDAHARLDLLLDPAALSKQALELARRPSGLLGHGLKLLLQLGPALGQSRQLALDSRGGPAGGGDLLLPVPQGGLGLLKVVGCLPGLVRQEGELGSNGLAQLGELRPLLLLSASGGGAGLLGLAPSGLPLLLLAPLGLGGGTRGSLPGLSGLALLCRPGLGSGLPLLQGTALLLLPGLGSGPPLCLHAGPPVVRGLGAGASSHLLAASLDRLAAGLDHLRTHGGPLQLAKRQGGAREPQIAEGRAPCREQAYLLDGRLRGGLDTLGASNRAAGGGLLLLLLLGSLLGLAEQAEAERALGLLLLLLLVDRAPGSRSGAPGRRSGAAAGLGGLLLLLLLRLLGVR